MLRFKLLTAAAIAVLSFGNLQAQEAEVAKNVAETVEAIADEALTEAVSEGVNAEATKVSLDEEGKLVGSTFIAGEETPLEAKVTIANSEGVVVDSVDTQADGSFAFTSIAPGSYNMYGSAASYAGAQTFDVLPHAGGGCSTCDLGLTTFQEPVFQEPVFEQFAQAPCSACSAPPVSPCGCGGGGGGGGLFSSRLFRLGAIGGVVAIATGGDDDDDASPDN